MASRPSKRPPGMRDKEPGPRHQAREAAVQVLYGIDSARAIEPDDLERTLMAYWTNMEGPLPGRAYCDQLVRGVISQRDAIDAAIRLANPVWRIERMARVDRNIIRIATWEMLFSTDVAPEVAMDEAIEVARKFGTEDSPAFVNGTLDKIASMQGKTTRKTEG